MAALDDLKAAVAGLNTSVSAEIQAIANKLTALGDSVSAADVETQVVALNDLKGKIDAETATLTGPPANG